MNLFQEAYTRNGGFVRLGYAVNCAHWWDNKLNTSVVVQDFEGGTNGYSMIVHDERNDDSPNTIPAFVVQGPIRQEYVNRGHYTTLGAPTTDEFVNFQGQNQQSFQSGYIVWNGSSFIYRNWPTIFINWKAEYFNGYYEDNNLTGYPAYIGDEGNQYGITYNWGTNAPGNGHTGVWEDHFAVRFSKLVYLSANTTYTFTISSDDGIRVRVGSDVIIDDFTVGHKDIIRQFLVNDSGYYEITVEYFEKTGDAYLSFNWTGNDDQPQIPSDIQCSMIPLDLVNRSHIASYTSEMMICSIPPGQVTPFGMNIHLVQRYYYGANPISKFREAASMADTIGVNWAREEFNWAALQPFSENDPIPWDKLDAAVNAYEDQNINILGMLAYTPSWARPDWGTSNCSVDNLAHRPPADMQQWYNFVYEIALHYKGRIDYWEIWNEPNLDLCLDDPEGVPGDKSYENYLQILQNAKGAIRTANPNAYIVAGAFAGAPWEYDHGANKPSWLAFLAEHREDYDIISIHPYQNDGHRGPFTQSLTDDIVETKKIIGNTPLWLTEIGWCTPDGNDELFQAFNLPLAYAIALHRGADKVFWYTFNDVSTANDLCQRSYGLIDWQWNNDGIDIKKDRKLSYYAYWLMTLFSRSLSRTNVTNMIGQNDDVYIIWNNSAFTETVTTIIDLEDVNSIQLDYTKPDAFKITPLHTEPYENRWIVNVSVPPYDYVYIVPANVEIPSISNNLYLPLIMRR